MMYPPPPRIRARRFFREVKPRSATQMTREEGPFPDVVADLADQVSVGGAAGQDHTRTGCRRG